MRGDTEYVAAVRHAADQLTLSAWQRAQLAILLAPARRMLATAVCHRPDLPVGIVRARTEVDG